MSWLYKLQIGTLPSLGVNCGYIQAQCCFNQCLILGACTITWMHSKIPDAAALYYITSDLSGCCLNHGIPISLPLVIESTKANFSAKCEWVNLLQFFGYCQYPVSCDYKAKREYVAMKILSVHPGYFIYHHIHLLWSAVTAPCREIL